MTETTLPTIIVDAHQDIAYNYMLHQRDYRQAALKTRRLEGNRPAQEKYMGYIANGLPDAILGRVAVVFGTIFVDPANSAFAPPNHSYRNAEEAYELAMRQMDYYHRLADEEPRIRLLRHQSDLAEVLASWADNKEIDERLLGILLSMEGADPIKEPPQTEEWYERGLRAVGPAWDTTRYAGSAYHPDRFTTLGYELMEVMASFNMILDLSHLADVAALEALDHYEGTLIASHSNPRYFVDRERLISDVLIERLAERDGVVGINFFNLFIRKGWTTSDPPDSITIQDLVAMIDYVCQLTGSARYVGLGSDIDGGFGTESMPMGIDTVTDFWKLNQALADIGYSADDIKAILGGNFLRIISQILPT